MANQHRNGPQLTWANIILTLTLLGGGVSAMWVLFQTQFSALEDQIKDAHLQTDRLRDRVVPREENNEVVKRLDSELSAIQRRLDILETTRPTTGELQSAAASLKDQIGEIKQRLRFLEQVPVLKPDKLSPSSQ